MPDDETIFSGIEGVVGEVLDPDWGMRLREHAEADLEHVHVNEGDLRPVGKVGL